MDLVQLTQHLTPYLIPLLPYLAKAGEGAAEEAGKSIAGAAWSKTKELWQRLQPKIEAKPAALEAVNDALRAPQDTDVQTVLRVQLKKLLDEDAPLAQEITRLWEEAKAAGAPIIQSGERNVNVGGANYGNINTGDIRKS